MNNGSGKIRDFTDLNAWKFSHELVLDIYKISNKFPAFERFGLTSQIQRASVSITSNIAEGFGRQSYREKVQFYYLAHGSLTEVKNQLLLSKDLGYISKDFERVMEKLVTSQRLLQGLIKTSKSFIIHKS
ncbi:MAG TPA: four helix bundle protein [Candidatus Paceibacterota bacterium]